MKWEKTEIKNICTGIYDGPHATPPVSDSGAIFLGISNFNNGRLDLSEVRYISEEDLPKWTKRVTPQENDIVFSYEATLNLYTIIPKDFRGCLGRRMALLRVDERRAYYKFLFYYFYSDAWQAVIRENTVLGATVDRIPLIRFPNFQVELPPLETQHRIADILSAYDDLIENNRKQIKLLEEAAQRLHKEWFVNLRFPGYEHTKITDGVPEGWKIDLLSNIVKTTSGGTPARSHPEYYINGSTLWVKTQELLDAFILDTEEKITDEAITNSSTKLVSKGSILMAMYGATIGKLGIASQDLTCNQACCVFDVSGFKYGGMYLFCWLFENRKFLIKLGKGVAQSNLSQTMIKNLNILIPDMNVLHQFSCIVDSLYLEILANQKRITILSEARDRLLPKLMSGEVEV